MASALGSEYKRAFREYEVQPRVAAYKPAGGPSSFDAVMESVTTNRSDYREHPIQRQGPVKPADNNLTNDGNHDFHTSYSHTFTGVPGERARPIRQDKEKAQLDKFVGEPSYLADYREWSLPPRHQRQTDRYQAPSDPFQGVSTSKQDFQHHGLSPVKPLRRRQEWDAPDGPFTDSTGYRDTYTRHALEARAPRVREVYSQPAVTFQGQSTKQADFIGHYQPKRESCKPNQTPLASDTPFDDSTTSKTDYKEKPLGRRFVRNSDQYVKPEGDMYLSTTNQNEFKEHPLSRHVIKKPDSSHAIGQSGSMAKESGYQADFQEVVTPRREMMKPKNTYQPPEVKFEGLSTAKGDFVEKPYVPTTTYRPKWEPVSTGVAFENVTENRESFVEKPIQPRPRREREVYAAPAVAFRADTTTRESYRGDFVPKRSSFKPQHSPLSTDVKFDDSTTFGSDFKQHPVSPRYRHEQDKYVKPPGEIDLKTSSRETFKDFGPAERHVIHKPGSSGIHNRGGLFEARSSYAGDFKEHGNQRREAIKAKSDYQPSTDRFASETTTRASYTGSYAPKPASFKPANRPLQQLDAFEDVATNRREYKAWRDVTPQTPTVSA